MAGHEGENLILTILGMKGSGKSTLAGEIIKEYPRVLILDAYGEYTEYPKVKVTEGGPNTVTELLFVRYDKKFTVVAMIVSREEALNVLAVAFEIPDLLIVLEEASLYTSPHELPNEIATILRYGRKRQISMIVIARRPSEISRELTAQSDLLVTFRQTEPRDIEYLRARMGEDADNAPTLPDYKVLVAGDRSKAPLAVLSRLEKT